MPVAPTDLQSALSGHRADLYDLGDGRLRNPGVRPKDTLLGDREAPCCPILGRPRVVGLRDFRLSGFAVS